MELMGMFLLSIIEGIGYKKQQQILDKFNNFKALSEMNEKKLMQCSLLTKTDRTRLLWAMQHFDEIEGCYHKMKEAGIGYVSREQCAYPALLKNGIQPPCGLFYKGKLPPNHRKKIAIVGARMCSGYGKTYAAEIAREVVKAGGVIISGMARGVDGIAQKAAIEAGGETYAVVASGVDVVYPPEHRGLYEAICHHGGVISEYTPGTEPSKGMFPQRNRLISGIADAVIIIEARERSGSLITGDLALEQGKDIYVLPGRLDDPLSVGCNRYIKQGAGIITSISELLDELHFFENNEKVSLQETKLTLEKEDVMVYSCLRLTPRSVDEIMNETGLPFLAVVDSIARLLEENLCEELSKNQFCRRS
ncbi:DNA processing protein [Lachnospiraceae bacterium XBB1006]|nr:DNA processing protein [Lachnospiraceae bacterium XBB1006]